MTRQWLTAVTCVLCLAFVAFAPTAGLSQAVYGGIFGTVTDPTGASVPGAKVTITSVGQGTTTEVTTNAAGNYTVTRLIPGLYNIRAEASGFKAHEVTNMEVFADVSNHVDMELQVGAVAETVTVTAEDVPLLKTDRADVAQLFTEKQVSELPIFDRNFTTFQLLTPGAMRLTSFQHASSENPQGGVQIMMNGQHFSGTSFQLDGTDNRDPILGIIVINPTLESVTQTKITAQNYDAEFGMALAGVVAAQTKSGTNDIHGSAFMFRRNDTTQARNPFTQNVPDALTGKLLPEDLWTQFGGSIGGPIVKDKLFLFGDYQGTRRNAGNSVLINVPTSTVRNTCLNSASAICDLSEYGVAIFDPATGNPDGSGRIAFPGAIIPASQLSPQAVALLIQLTAPNAAGIENNFSKGGAETFDDDAFNIRGDYHHTDNLHIFGRYSWADFSKSAPGVFGGGIGGKGLGIGSFAGSSLVTNQSLAAGFDYVVNPNLLTDFRFGWLSYEVNVLPNGIGTSPAGDVGIPGLNTDDFFNSGMPAFFIGDSFTGSVADMAFGFQLDENRLNRCNCPLVNDEWQAQFVNNWTYIRGDHTFKFGADIRHAENLRVPSDAHRSGQLRFHENGTGDLNAGGGLGLATYLLGNVTSFERFVGTSIDAEESQNRLFFYGQDTWRINPKWTLNFGLRWEIYRTESVNGAGQGGFGDLEAGVVRVAGFGNIGLDGNVDNTLTSFAPRIGLAYQATPRTVIRLGYGRSYDIGVFGTLFGHVVTQNIPVLALQQLTPPLGSNFNSVFDLATGPPAFVTPAIPADGLLPIPDGVNPRIRPTEVILPTVDQWNLTIQHQITSTMSLEVGYVGNKGTHVFAGDGPAYNINEARLEGFLGADGILGTPDDVSNNDRKPFFNRLRPDGTLFNWTQGVNWFGNDADNNYHALQVKLHQRFSEGLMFQSNYTWSKALGFDGSYFFFDRNLNYGPASFDRTHVWVTNAVWEVPFGRGKQFGNDVSGVMDRILGGWQLNTVFNISSGLPFSPSLSGGTCGLFRDTGPCRPDKIGNVGSGGSGQFFQTSGIVGLGADTDGDGIADNPTSGGPWALPAPGTFGNAARNSLRGPRFWDVALGIMKKVSITEKVVAEFRADAFNIFNHVNLAQPDSCVDCGSNDATINGIASGAQQRQWQFGLRILF